MTEVTSPWLGAYPEGVRPHLEYPVQPLGRFLEQAAERYPEQTGLVFFGKKTSYKTLLEKAERFASSLISLGVKQGDRVALILPNCPQFVITYFGILRLGAVVVPVNPLSVEREIAKHLRDTGCRVAVCLDALVGKLAAVREEAGLETCIVTGLQDYMPTMAALRYRHELRRSGGGPDLPSGLGLVALTDLLNRERAVLPEVSIDPQQDLAVLQFTGGTTGTPKAAMLTHYNLVANTLQIKEWFVGSKTGREVFLGALPFANVYGMTVVMNFAVSLAATLVVLPRFAVLEALRAIQRYKVTIFPGTPAMYMAVSTHPKTSFYDLSSVRACISGAAALSAEVADLFEKITGGLLVEGYGLTEASPVTHCNPFFGERKAGSAGLPLPDTECRIVDLQHGTKELSAGVAGELIIRGPQVMKGYWNRPEETADTLREGWLYTGDIARLDKSDFVYIVDRKKDLLISGGYNIYPQEVEAVLLELPQIADVAVVGLPDSFQGERLKAFLVLKEGAAISKEEILEHCQQRLAAYKIPRLFEFRCDLPKIIVGKTLRRILLEEEKSKP
ncbi:MAG: long-chain fatty acid--CoA ligase [Firmicutes bacterium]|nr:long-chain fatty acid--CoA ligase [Bacillota bacterium]